MLIEENIDDNQNSEEKIVESSIKHKSSDDISVNDNNAMLDQELIDLETHADEVYENKDQKNVDYSELSKEELLEQMRQLIDNHSVEEIKDDISLIKTSFYKIVRNEKDLIRKELIEGGAEGEIEIPIDPLEDYLKELLADFKKKRAEYNDGQEVVKMENLRKKEDIIERIKNLANGEESLNKTFSEFKELQKMWTEIGPVPNSESSTLWNNYQLQIERFYDFIKINKELRDLDLKKNLENKLEICEKAEALFRESDVVKAYKTLQEYHELWKEIGPVESDKRDEVWQRFSEATKIIRQAYQDHFLELKKEREINYNQKLAFCEKVESITRENLPQNKREWVEKSKEVLEIQKLWKSIGMVPRELNEEIYERFRAACNKFFEEKKDFFNTIDDEFNKNLQMKIDICVQAEGMQNSTDWKGTSDLFFELQKKWKEIGPVPQKKSDIVWKRFRAACDYFFNAKDSFYGKIEESQEENLNKKREILKQIKDFKESDNLTENMNRIKELQKLWLEIGHVPQKQKIKLQGEYKDAINDLYSKINLSRKEINNHSYKMRIDHMKESDDQSQLKVERSKITTKINAIEDDIRLWENNMTFFSGNAKNLLGDFNTKVEQAKEELALLKERKKMLDLAIKEIMKNKEGKQ